VREQLATYLDKEFPVPEKRVTQPALRCLEKTTQTDIQGKPSQSLRNQNTSLKKRIISKDTEIKRKSSQIFYLQKKMLGLTQMIKRKKNKIKKLQSRCDDFKTKLQEKEEEANNLLAENDG
jgi:predicted RNase H-like nuclease (RuvC/YqgF family)